MSTAEHLSPLARSSRAGRPRLPPGLLVRSQLLDRLSQGLGRRLTLISAPAGSGKTTLLAQWTEHIERRCFWVALGETDSDFEGYLLSLLAALEPEIPGVSQTTLRILRSPKKTTSARLAEALCSDLESVEGPSVLVVDNYERVLDPAAHEFTRSLVRYLPPAIHPVIACRMDPPVALARWRAAEQLAELRAAELNFTPAESQSFLRRVLKDRLPEAALQSIVAQSQGWPAGLRLAALSLSGPSSVDPQRVPSGRSRLVMDYFLEEVLAREGPEIIGFLIRCSILDQVCAPLASPLAGVSTSSAAEFLDYLERNGLFVFALEGREGWYRLHPMLRETLRKKLEASETPPSVRRLHGLASEWYAVQGPVTEAIRHALLAGDSARACRLAEESLMAIMGQENLLETERILGLLPAEAVLERPTILAMQARLLGARAGWRQDLPMLETARDVLNRSARSFTEQERVVAEGLIALVTTSVLFFSGDIRHCQENAERTLRAWRGKQAFGEGWAGFFLGVSDYMLGNAEAGRNVLGRALEEGQSPGRSLVGSFALMGLAFTHLLAGRLAESERAAAAMLSVEVAAGRQSLVAWASYLLGAAAYETNHLVEARQHFDRVLATGDSAAMLAMLDARFGSALACGASAEAEEGDAQLDEAERYILEGNNLAFLPSLHSIRARLAMMRGDFPSARSWLEVTPTRLPPGPMLFLAVPPLAAAQAILADGGRQASKAGLELLGRVEARCRSEHNVRHLLPTLALQALALGRLGRRSTSRERLEEAVDIGRSGGFVRSFVDLGPSMASLLQEAHFPPAASAYVDRVLAAFAGSGAKSRTGEAGPPREPLTPREREILSLLQRRLTNDEIARALGISVLTVKRHTGNLYGKLGAADRRQAVRRAIALGLLAPD